METKSLEAYIETMKKILAYSVLDNSEEGLIDCIKFSIVTAEESLKNIKICRAT